MQIIGSFMMLRLEQILQEVPTAVKRLGSETFLPVPVYHTQKAVRAVYINQSLYERLFGECSYEEMVSNIQSQFGTTIEKQRAKGPAIGTAYVDYQADPFNFSLEGNLGSGRAYYIGRYFNIKGEKTPLATSPEPRYSDGFLEMERGIWETWIANVLQGSLQNGLCEVLAILDLEEDCTVLWRAHPVRRIKIIRMDMNGELDRVTHRFFNRKALTVADLEKTAMRYGILEADKFAERILHGSWSPGNISLAGHFIDFDSVAATKGRAPQYSFTKYHHENFFGQEYEGQLHVLKALCDNSEINRDQADYTKLQAILLESRTNHLALRLVGLMGFADSVSLYTAYATELAGLALGFATLSQKCIANPEALFAKRPLSLLHHIFDFSAIFRIFPLLLRQNLFSAEIAVEMIMINPVPERLDGLDISFFSENDRNYLETKVLAHFSEHFVTSFEMLHKLKQQAVNFVTAYADLFTRMMVLSGENPLQVEARAYLVNEDRFYFLAPFTLSYAFSLAYPHISNQRMQQLLTLVEQASRRTPDNLLRLTDLRIYRNGYYGKRLDGNGQFQHVVGLFQNETPMRTAKSATISIDEEKFPAIFYGIKDCAEFVTDRYPFASLVAAYDRYTVFLAHAIKLFVNGREIEFDDWLT